MPGIFNKFKRREQEDFIIDSGSQPTQLEALRHIKANMLHLLPKKEDGRANVIAIVSTTRLEGSSTVSDNLAEMFARSGAKTIYIDCDLRRGSGDIGLSDYLGGKSELNLQPDARGLAVIPSGSVTGEANELLSSAKLSELLQKLSGEYEYIFLKTSPLSEVSDGFVVIGQADGVVIVTRHRNTSRVRLHNAIEELKFTNAKILGFVVTDK